MELFVNILTLSACFATMTYCYVLAKRIDRFRNMKDGMGALIEEMIRTTSDLQNAFNATQQNIDMQYHKIQDKIDEGIALNEYLSNIISDIEKNYSSAPSSRHQSVVTEMTINAVNPHPHQNTLINEIYDQNDPFDDVVPADFDLLKRKKRPKIIIPGEEYL